MKHLATCALGLITFLLLDKLWLGVIAYEFYQRELDFLLGPEFKLAPALLLYTLMTTAAFVFAVRPDIHDQPLHGTIWRAAFLGFVTYAAYDLTNQTTIENWPVIVTVVDTLWGAVAMTIISIVMHLTYRKFTGSSPGTQSPTV